MEISSIMVNVEAKTSTTNVKTNFTEKISKDEAQEIRAQITENARNMMISSTNVQSSISTSKDVSNQDFKTFLNDIGYEGKAIANLSQSEAAELVSEDGFFGIDQTSQRIADFVINGSGGDESMMRAGREGMLQGFKEAEAMWGGELPEISQKTMQKALEMVDKAMYDLGYSVLDTEA